VEGLECINIEERRKITYGVTYCSGARRASVAVWGSLKERLSLLNGTWVSPGVVACHGAARYITLCMRKKSSSVHVKWESCQLVFIDKKRVVRTKTMKEDEEILIGSVIAWRIAERRRDGR
jgi:hypothetical protein